MAFEITSAKGDERQQVEKLLDSVDGLVTTFSEEMGLLPIFEADKGYDSRELREKLLKRKIYPLISYRKIGKLEKDRFMGVKKALASRKSDSLAPKEV
ncbi:transposase [Parachlamydia sp. AcF125]|uniref:transposase n=1 Tax=Parachlamydia sp. AcF125 TaxID=2795736 RepID=UPI001BC993CC|nr:hypothetical protein [Parachlamydia sp. AcF125]